jgi:hypothetical protein
MKRHARAIPLLIALVAAAAIGCDDDDKALCALSRNAVDFDSLASPPFGEDTLSLPVTVTNFGDSDLSGHVTIQLDTPNPSGPWFSIDPENPEFVIPPGGSRTFAIVARLENGSSGSFTGTVDFGTVCGSVPLMMVVSQSQ